MNFKFNLLSKIQIQIQIPYPIPKSKYLDEGVGVTDGPAVVGGEVRDTLGTELAGADPAELVGSLGGGDPVEDEPALGVVERAEDVLLDLGDGDNIHETNGVVDIRADLAYNMENKFNIGIQTQ